MVAAAAYIDAAGINAPAIPPSTRSALAEFRAGGFMVGNRKYTATSNREGATLVISDNVFSEDNRTVTQHDIAVETILEFLGVTE